MHQHPEWFNVRNEAVRQRMLSSIAKRIVGEIVAGPAKTGDGG